MLLSDMTIDLNRFIKFSYSRIIRNSVRYYKHTPESSTEDESTTELTFHWLTIPTIHIHNSYIPNKQKIENVST